MNSLTVVDRGGVKHPDILTEDEAQNLLDRYGTGGQAITIPSGVNLQTFLGRCVGGFYVDDAKVSNNTGGPLNDLVYYTVISGGVPGNRAIVASSHGNNLWIAEVYGDVFRGWITFSRPQDVADAVNLAITTHEASRNHPYALETAPGFIELADPTEAVSKTNADRAMTSLRTQNLLDTYGIGTKTIVVPATNLVTYFSNAATGYYHLDALNTYTNAPAGETTWAEVYCSSHEVVNYKSLIMVTANGILYTGAITAGAFSGWRKKIELADIPLGSTSVRGIVQLEDSVSSGNTGTAATANAVRVANDNANSRVPATRRINGQTLQNDISITPGSIGTYTAAEIDAKLRNLGAVQDIRWTGAPAISNESFNNYAQGRITTAPDYSVLVQLADVKTDGKPFLPDIDVIWYRYLQKQMGGVWYNVGG